MGTTIDNLYITVICDRNASSIGWLSLFVSSSLSSLDTIFISILDTSSPCPTTMSHPYLVRTRPSLHRPLLFDLESRFPYQPLSPSSPIFSWDRLSSPTCFRNLDFRTGPCPVNYHPTPSYLHRCRIFIYIGVLNLSQTPSLHPGLRLLSSSRRDSWSIVL